ncbi:hypothetical protein GJ496_010958 [Pomphorhynchus laevis]|nr:hypothetical protein GJ496_010958 [Pomphorhynchus laevis]
MKFAKALFIVLYGLASTIAAFKVQEDDDVDLKMNKILQRVLKDFPEIQERIASLDHDEFSELQDIWKMFKSKYAKVYTDAKSEKDAMNNLSQKIRHILKIKFSDKKTHFKIALNEFSDLSEEQLKTRLYGLRIPKSKLKSLRTKLKKRGNSKIDFKSIKYILPSVDLRERGIISPVKNQKECGGCYSFATTGLLEAVHKFRSNTSIVFSEQQLIDCSRKYGNLGCEGGLMEDCFAYLKDHGIQENSTYPYVNDDGKCRYDPNKTVAYVSHFRTFEPGDEVSIMHTLQYTPVAVGIDASSFEFTQYAGGIFDSENCFKEFVNHAVLLVGYGSETDENNKTIDYWIIKNSWGPTWGEDGYVRLLRNGQNYCGVASIASTAIL